MRRNQSRRNTIFHYMLIFALLLSAILQLHLQPVDSTGTFCPAENSREAVTSSQSSWHHDILTDTSGVVTSNQSNTSESQTTRIGRLVMVSVLSSYLSLRLIRLVYNKLGYYHSSLGEHFKYLNPHSIYIHSNTPKSIAVILCYIHSQTGEKNSSI